MPTTATAAVLPADLWPAMLLWEPDQPDVDRLDRLSDDGWRYLAATAAVHQLAPMLHWQLRQLLPAGIPEPVADQLRRAHRESVMMSIFRQRNLIMILRGFHAAGFAPALSKGIALANFVYPEPACRPMGDIDLWVDAAAMPAACAVLEQLGYVQHIKDTRPLAMQAARDGEVQFVGKRGEGLVELHWGAFAGEWLRLTTQIDRAEVRQRWQAHSLLGQEVFLLAPEDAFIQIAVHLCVNHQMSLLPLRSMLDLALLARQGLDCDLVVARARAWGLATVIGLVLEVLTTLFPVPEVAPAAAALRLTPYRRRPLSHFTGPAQVLDGEALSLSRRRLLFQMALVDRPRDLARLLWRTLWPEPDWLAGRYGQYGPGVRLRHAMDAMQGRV